jgi:hypothetical protein
VGAVLATGMLAVTASGDSSALPAPGGAAADATGLLTAGGGGAAVPPDHPPAPWADARAALARELSPLDAAAEVRLAVTVLDPLSGRSLSYGSGHFDTASVVKVDVVAALLLRAQDEGRGLTARERELAAEAIRISDNDATHELWKLIGGAPGLDAANARLGLSETAGGGDGHWGLTQTTTADQIALLRAVFGTDSPLSAGSRETLQKLMGSVVEGQRWGISAASALNATVPAAPGPDGADIEVPDAAASDTALKNGWLPRSHTKLWNINSIGRVSVHGRQYLVAVLSAGHQTKENGIEAAETAARSAVAVIRSAPVA